MEGEIVDVNVRLKQVVRQQFSRTSWGIASEAWVVTSRLNHRLLAWRGWWLVTVKEKEYFVPNHNKYVEPHDILD